MLSLRKAIARRSWLLAVLSFMLLALNQQVIACDIMMMSPDQAGQHCQKHGSGTQQMDPTKKACCDFSFEFSAAGTCQNDHGSVTISSLSGKFNPDYHPLIITVSLQDVFPYPRSTLLSLAPDREASRPGARTYLITQRLRI